MKLDEDLVKYEMGQLRLRAFYRVGEIMRSRTPDWDNARKSLDRLKLSAMAYLGRDQFRHALMTATHETTELARKEAQRRRDEIRADKRERFRQNDGFDYNAFKVDGYETNPILNALYCAAVTISLKREALESLSFGIDTRDQFGTSALDRDTIEADFHVLYGMIHQESQYAWLSLLLFSGVAPDNLRKLITAAALRTYAGIGDDDAPIEMSVIQWQRIGLEPPSRYQSNESDDFKTALHAAVDNLKK